MSKIFIPEVGDTLVLIEEWIFSLVKNHKTKNVFDVLNAPYLKGLFNSQGEVVGQVKLPAGTVVVFEDIYAGKKSSKTVELSTTIKNKKCRFFANISDINKMNADKV